MKKSLFIFFLLSVFCVKSNAQGIFHYYTGLFLADTNAAPRHDKFGVDIFYNSWQDRPEDIKIKPTSIGVNINRIYDIPFGKSNFGIGLGWGFSFHYVRHNGYFVDDTINLNTNESITRLISYPETYNYRKNSLSTNYVELPFEFRIRTRKKRKEDGSYNKIWRLYPGFKIGYLMNIHTSKKDDLGKFKTYNFYNINKIRYGATVRFGRGRTNLYGFYSLTNLFKENKGAELRPFGLGLTILF